MNRPTPGPLRLLPAGTNLRCSHRPAGPLAPQDERSQPAAPTQGGANSMPIRIDTLGLTAATAGCEHLPLWVADFLARLAELLRRS